MPAAGSERLQAAAAGALALLLVLLCGAYGADGQQSEFDRALGLTTVPVTNPPVINIKTWAHDVALDNCMKVGEASEFQVEWQIRGEPQNILEVRFTADSTRGFTGLGFQKSGKFQIISGNPVEQTPCARSLYDTITPYDLDGAVFPSYIELPGNAVSVNSTHAVHYAVRNISVTATRMLMQGGSMSTNVTVVWAYMQSSLFKGACYQGNVDAVTEMAKMQLVLGDATYAASAGCKKYEGTLERHLGQKPLDAARNLLEGERHQSTRVALLLFGGDMLVRSGRNEPNFDTVSGRVTAGENAAGVCQASLTTLKAYWNGFSDRIGGIVEYQVSAGTIEKPSRYFYRETAQTNLAYTRGELELTKNTTIIVTVEAYNFATLFKAVTSKPIYVLNGGSPVFGSMYNGLYTHHNDDYSNDNTRLQAHWKNWIGEDHSIKDYHTNAFTDNGYDYAVGETDGTLDSVVAWTHVAGFESERTVTGLSLTHGKKFSISIRATNCAGAQTVQSSPGVLIDLVPPTPGRVFVGNLTNAHRNKIFRAEHLQASWAGFTDTTSGIKTYEWAMSTHVTPPSIVGNTGLIMGWTDVGRLEFARNGTIANMPRQSQLTVGADIYVHVKAIDNAGNFVIANSNATKIMGF
jgi:hypothetical protein